uniref:endonuclease n=1 Tax=Candidatus Fimenecus sp. TaxID=3022888 RepID=UPI0040292304
MLRQNANKLVLCCMLAVVLAVSVVLPSVTNSSNVAIADSSTTSYYSGNYYNSIDTSLRGDDFRDKLANLITTTHTDYTSYAGLANAYKTTDAVPNKSGYITWFYTGTEVKFSGFGGSGGQTNREHVWPKDGGSAFSATSECGSDAHHLRPTECNLNSTRGSKSFGEVEQSTQNVVNQNKSASYGDGTADSLCYTSGSFFYPAAGYRGATARILMYVQTRWGNKFNLQFVDGAGHSKTIGDFKTLMKWHLEELPTQEEINRNQAVYEIQGNRNPFIDHPEYAAYIYSEAGSYYANNGTTMANEVNALLANNNPYGGQTNVEPTKLTLDAYSCTLEVGQSRALTLGVVPANGNKSVTWESKDRNVATVDQNGKITAVGTGTATIAAVSKVNAKVAAYCVVTVVKPRSVVMVEVDGTPTKTVYNAGDKFDPTGLTVTVLFDSGDVENVPIADCKWTDGNTLEETLSAGTTTVKCSYKGVTSDNIVGGITVKKVVAAQKTITITVGSFGKAGYNWQNWTAGDVSGFAYLYTSGGKMQFNRKKGTAYLYNETALSGGIKSITMKGDGEWQLLTNNVAYPQKTGYASGGTDCGNLTLTASGVTWTLDGNNEYFALNLISTGAAYPTEIVITYGNAAEECEHVAGEWETEKAATCVADGSRVQRCSVCNEVLHSETIAATGHAYGEWTVRTEPTATTDGLKERRCQHCDDVQTEVVPATGSDKPDPIDPNPDKPGDDKPDTDKPGDDKNSGGMTISCNSVITSSAAILLAAAVVPVAIAVKRKRD